MANPPLPKGTILDFKGTKADGKGGTIPNPATEYYPVPMTIPNGSEWKPVTLPHLIPGYRVSLYGEVISPKDRKVKPQFRGGHVMVAMRLKDSSNSTTVRVDELVLSTFGQVAPDMVPEHIDDDNTNCQFINLRWREPTERERRAKKSAATARKARGRKASPPAPKAKKSPAVPRPSSEVEVLRVYRAGGLQITVTPTGEIPAKALPQGRLSVLKVAALAKILNSIVEMNTFMEKGN